MQSADCIEGRQDRTFLPCRYIRRMLTRQDNAPVDLAEILVMPFARFVRPATETTIGKRNPAPAHRNTRFEFAQVLRMNPRALRHRYPDSLRGRQGPDLVRIRSPYIGAEQHAFAGAAVVAGRITNRRYGQVRVGYSAIDVLVLLPEAALELKADLDRRLVRHGTYRILHRRPHVDVDLAQDGQRDRAYQPVRFGLLRSSL